MLSSTSRRAWAFGALLIVEWFAIKRDGHHGCDEVNERVICGT